MLTADQQKWINHLSGTDKITVFPFDSTAEEKFRIVKHQIQLALGINTKVEHHGATSLGISGQDEVDVYVPVQCAQFDDFLAQLEKLFGKPQSLYTRQRARFVTTVNGKHIDVFLINDKSVGWLNCNKFEMYLKSHPVDLETYCQMKEEGSGLNVREYYRRKTEFINEIVKKAF